MPNLSISEVNVGHLFLRGRLGLVVVPSSAGCGVWSLVEALDAMGGEFFGRSNGYDPAIDSNASNVSSKRVAHMMLLLIWVSMR